MSKPARAGAESRVFAQEHALLFDANPEPMFVIDRDSLALLAVNDAAVRHYGYSRDEFLAMALPELWPPKDRPRYRELFGSQPKDGPVEVGLRRHQRKDGSILTVKITRHPFEFAGKRAVLAMARDVTEDHSVREALKEKEDLFALLVHGIKDYGIIMLDAGGRVLTWNEGARRNTGFESDEVLGRHWACFYTPEDVRQGAPDAALIIAEGKGRCEQDGWRMRKDGARFYAECVLTALRDSSGSLRGFASITRDITERRALEQRILDAAEREQKRIGQDLHDSLGQRLTGIALLVRALEQKLSAERRREAAADAKLIRERIAEATEETRRLARGLYSAALEANDLGEALRQLLDDANFLFGLKTKLDYAAELPALTPEVSTHLYHISQEAIHNAARHGRAKRVWLSLESLPTGPVLAVRDDGIGIPARLPAHRGMGLRIMQYRAGLIGGQLSVGPRPEGGTEVVCRLGPGEKK